MKSRHRKTGVTFLELLIALIIIGILASVSFPKLLKTMEKAKLGEVVTNLNLIRTGQKIYFLQYTVFSPTIDDLRMEDPNPSRYFDYTSGEGDLSEDFIARAQRLDNAPEPYNGYWYEISKDGVIFSNGPFFPNRQDDDDDRGGGGRGRWEEE